MHCKYLPQDYEARMNGGVAFYDGKPVLLSAVGGVVEICSFPNGDLIKRIVPDDPLLDLASPSLGYVNMTNRTYYVYRKPERKYKQTLTYGALAYFDPLEEKLALRIQDVFYTENFKSMLEGKYPKFEAANAIVAKAENNVKSRAISRDVALAVDSFGIVRVFYKMDEVGHIDGKSVIIPHSDLAWVVSKYLTGYGWEVK